MFASIAKGVDNGNAINYDDDVVDDENKHTMKDEVNENEVDVNRPTEHSHRKCAEQCNQSRSIGLTAYYTLTHTYTLAYTFICSFARSFVRLLLCRLDSMDCTQALMGLLDFKPK